MTTPFSSRPPQTEAHTCQIFSSFIASLMVEGDKDGDSNGTVHIFFSVVPGLIIPTEVLLKQVHCNKIVEK